MTASTIPVLAAPVGPSKKTTFQPFVRHHVDKAVLLAASLFEARYRLLRRVAQALFADLLRLCVEAGRVSILDWFMDHWVQRKPGVHSSATTHGPSEMSAASGDFNIRSVAPASC